jgi:pimeloyl-ACP methyl ester carboxylesterase
MSAAAGSLHSGFVQAGSLRLHHTFGGRGTPPLVMVHGLGSSGYLEWRFNLPALAASQRVLAPDLPGFGRSERPRAGYGIPLFARAVHGYLRALRLRPVVLVGASLGGRVAIEVALTHTERVRKLVLVNAFGLGRPRPRLTYPLFAVPRVGEAVLRLTRGALRRAPPQTVRRFAGRYLRASGDLERTMDDAYLAGVRELHEAEGYHAAYLATLRSLARPGAIAQGRDVVARLARTRLPVLLVWGAEDPLFPVEHAERAHLELPGSRLAVIEGAGHTPQAERPDEFNRVVEAFLRA